MENKTLTQLESLAKTFKSSLAYYDEADSFADSVIEADYWMKMLINSWRKF